MFYSVAKEDAMVELSVSEVFAVDPEVLWEAVAFDKLADWHPLVPNLVLSEGGEVRTMGMGPMRAIERCIERGPLHYVYVVERSPMPVREYRAAWRVAAEELGARLTIDATYLPKGSPEEADELLRAFFAAGFRALETALG
jgi:hypothetical protein